MSLVILKTGAKGAGTVYTATKEALKGFKPGIGSTIIGSIIGTMGFNHVWDRTIGPALSGENEELERQLRLQQEISEGTATQVREDAAAIEQRRLSREAKQDDALFKDQQFRFAKLLNEQATTGAQVDAALAQQENTAVQEITDAPQRRLGAVARQSLIQGAASGQMSDATPLHLAGLDF